VGQFACVDRLIEILDNEKRPSTSLDSEKLPAGDQLQSGAKRTGAGSIEVIETVGTEKK